MQSASGALVAAADGHNRPTDFCLGDTDTIFGHSAAPVAAAISNHTSMLATDFAKAVGAATSNIVAH